MPVDGSDQDEDEDPEEVFVDIEPATADAPTKRRDHRRRMIDSIDEWRAEGYSYTEIVDLAIEMFECHPRTAERGIAASEKRWRDAPQTSIEERRARMRVRIDRTRRLQIAAGDFAALNGNDLNMIRLEGFNSAAIKVEHSGVVGLRPVEALSPAEVRAEIADLERRRLAAGGVPSDEDEPATMPAKRKRGN